MMRRTGPDRVKAVFCSVLMLVPITAQPGCNLAVPGGPLTAETALRPGQFLDVSHPSLTAGSTAKVRFDGPGGFDLEVDAPVLEDGQVQVAVPFLVDVQTGEFIEGEVEISLAGVSAAPAVLTVLPMPQLGGAEPGELLADVLTLSLELADSAEAKAADIADQLPGAVGDPSDLEFFTTQRTAVADLLDELEATGQIVVELGDGTSVTLGDAELARADRLLAASLLGIIEQTGGTTDALHKPIAFQGENGSILDFEALKEEFRRVASNAVNGGGALLGSAALIVAGGGLLLVGTTEVAVVGGLVLTVGGAVWAVGSTSVLDRIGAFFDDNLGELYNEGQIALEQAVSVATAAGATLRGKLGELFSGISALFTAKSTYDSFVALECQTEVEPPDQQKTSLVAFQETGAFCTVVLPETDLVSVCDNSCSEADDGFCDDGGFGSITNFCAAGTDCNDCGVRLLAPEDDDTDGDDGGTMVETGVRVWRVTNYHSGAEAGYITVLSSDADQDPPLLSTFPGGGIDPELRAELAVVTDAFATTEEAVDSVCSRVSDFFRPPLASFILMASFDGQVVGIDSIFQTRCEQ